MFFVQKVKILANNLTLFCKRLKKVKKADQDLSNNSTKLSLACPWL